MEFVKSTFLYYFKNIIPMLIFALIPAIYIGVLLNPFQSINFLWNYNTLEINGFADFFNAVFAIDWLTLLFFIVGIFVCTAFVSLILGKIESHFRTGKFSYSLKTTELNNNFLSVLLISALIFISYFLLMLVGVLLMLLAHFIVVINEISWVVGLVACAIITFLVYLAFVWVLAILSVTCVDMAIMGSPFSVALSNASTALHKKSFKNFLGILIPILVGVVFAILGCLLKLEFLFNTISLLFIIPYVCIFAVTKIFEHYDITRYDTRPYYNLR